MGCAAGESRRCGRTEQEMPTIKDVAREAGLSVGTVSRVLNNRGYISEETRQRVRAAMDQLGYCPNEMARSLSKQTSRLIGLIVPHISHPYFAELISAMGQVVSRSGYRLLLFNSQNDAETERKYIDVCRQTRVAGIIVCSAGVTENFRELDVPVIALERYCESAAATVECDNYGGGAMAARHLIGLGRKHLMVINGGDVVQMPADERAAAFAEVCRENGVSCREERATEQEYRSGDYTERLRRIFDAHESGATPVDGIFASGDVIAAEVLQEAAARGIRVPEELAVVSFDDTALARLTVPGLTSVHQPVGEIAETAMQLLMRSAAGQKVPERTVLPVTLVERGSTIP